MALNFPSTPDVNATYTFNNKTWTYTGNAWALSTSSLNTGVVVEGSNLYFTNARSRAAISVTGSGTYDSANGIITITGGSTYGDSNVALLSYATNANVALKANVADLKTANVAELTNLYFTNARVYSNVTQLGYITSSSLSGYATNSQLSSYATTSNSLAQFASTTSAQLATLISNETGSGSLVFATTPTLVTPVIGLATGTSAMLTANIGAAAGNVSGNFTAGNFQSAGSINAGGGTISSSTGRISLGTDSGGAISLGNVSSQGASTPYIDFNSGATSVDYDARILGTGGTGVAGKGTLSFTAATAAFSANITVGNVTLNTNGVLTFPDGTTQNTATSASGTLINIITRTGNVAVGTQNRTLSIQGRSANTTITIT